MKAQEEWQHKRHEANKEIAAQAASTQYGQLQTQESQERAAASQQIEEAQRRALQVTGTATTAAGEGGAMGASFNTLLQDYARQESSYQAAVRTNVGWRTQFRIEQAEAVHTRQQGNIASTQPKPPEIPSYVGGGLQIAGNLLALRAYGMRA